MTYLDTLLILAAPDSDGGHRRTWVIAGLQAIGEWCLLESLYGVSGENLRARKGAQRLRDW